MDVAGFSYIDIVSGTGQIELKYTEDFDGLNQLHGDGPWAFVVGLANSFRTETFNVTGPGRVQSTLLQGAQRWDTDNTIVVSSPGFEPSVEVCPTATLPGSVSSSIQNYTEIWALGARAVKLACFDSLQLGKSRQMVPTFKANNRQTRPWDTVCLTIHWNS